MNIYVVRISYANLLIWRGPANSVEHALELAPESKWERRAYCVLKQRRDDQ